MTPIGGQNRFVINRTKSLCNDKKTLIYLGCGNLRFGKEFDPIDAMKAKIKANSISII